eukprot:m.311598 g.311598  ORF g.311598 m.311598 type:complete len:228 (+) comp85585_c0_seq1:130-813(+)
MSRFGLNRQERPLNRNIWRDILDREEASKRLQTRDDRALRIKIKQLEKDRQIVSRSLDKQSQILKHELKTRQRRLSLQSSLTFRSRSAPPPRITSWRSTPELTQDLSLEQKINGKSLRNRKMSLGLSRVTCDRREVTSELREAVSLPCVIEEFDDWEVSSPLPVESYRRRRVRSEEITKTPPLARKTFAPFLPTTVGALATPDAPRKILKANERNQALSLPSISTVH